jgi:formylglycine-generating enzyme required for sulfatase activity/tRNA A-37 threonylcarbamoyl transferase component Bud32
MGIVYKARQLKLNRIVAIKMVLAGNQSNPEPILRFLQEAELAARVQHPNIVAVHEVGTHAGQPYLALEFIDGPSLAQKCGGKPQAPHDAAHLIELLADAVHQAHQSGIVHRDLKPANVLLTSDGVPKITDFGLARRLAVNSGLTQTGEVLGTPAYMSPEQAKGKKEIGPATDVHALGVILYELLTGRPPFQSGTVMDTVDLVINKEPRALRALRPEVPRDLETVCLKCLHKDPARRYASAAALAEDLRRFQAAESVVARPVGSLEKSWKWARRRPAVAGLLAAVVYLTVFGTGLVTWHWRSALAALAGEREARSEQALAQVEVLIRAHPAAVTELLGGVPVGRPEVVARLRSLWEEEDRPERRSRRMRAGLALLSTDPDRVRHELAGWMLAVDDPAETVLVRDALRGFGAELAPGLWTQLKGNPGSERRIRLLAALAIFDPNNPQWPSEAEAGLESLLSANPLHLGQWVEALRPVRSAWLAPLSEVFRGRKVPERREAAASVLARYASENPAVLADLLLDSDAKQHAILYPLLATHPDEAIKLLRRERDRLRWREWGWGLLSPVWEALIRELAASVLHQPALLDSEVNRSAERQANALVALARLGEPKPAWEWLRHRGDAAVRPLLIERLKSRGVEATQVLARLEVEKNASARAALIVALGEYGEDQLPGDQRERWVLKLLEWYRQDRDAGVHGAIDWLLRHGKEGPAARPLDWGHAKELDKIDGQASEAPPAGPEPGRTATWWVNRQGQTFTVIPGPVEFLMGSPPTEAGRSEVEKLQRLRIARSFAVATRPVTVRQFQAFLGAHPEVMHSYDRRLSPDRDGPIIAVTWYEAAQFCRWLSEREGMAEEEMCFPTVAEIEKCKENGTALSLPANYLSRKGYRLPTEAEWEYTCRAGTTASRFCGADEVLLGRYAWHDGNSRDRAWPVGQKRPNEMGMFDMLGNVWQWCQNSAQIEYVEEEKGEPGSPNEEWREVDDRSRCVYRGGAFDSRLSSVRCAARSFDPPSSRFSSAGFRIARTW